MKIGLDLGSSTFRLADSKKGVFLREPCAIGDGVGGGQRFVVGTTAEAMLGRTPPHLKATYPVQRGVVSAPKATGELLKTLLARTPGWRWRWRPEIVAAVPADIGIPHKESLLKVFRFAGVTGIRLVPTPVAAALGAVPQTDVGRATLVIDVGAETTEVAVVAPEIVVSDSIARGGRDLDRAILYHLRRIHGLEVSLQTAEELKRRLGSAHPVRDEKTIDVFGREMDSGLPHTVKVTGAEVRECLSHPLEEIATLVKRTFDRTPAGLSKDIFRDGLILTGNGARLEGLDQFLSERCRVSAKLATDPGDCVVLGLLRYREAFQKMTKDEE